MERSVTIGVVLSRVQYPGRKGWRRVSDHKNGPASPGSGPPAEASPSALLLSDRPLEGSGGDSLGFAAYADALAGIIGDSRTDTPLTVAISAAWGAGKTSLAKMIESRLLNEEVFPHRQNITCWFNAWMHDDAPNLGSAFAAMVARDVNMYRPAWRRLTSPLPSSFYSPQERWRRRIIMAAVSVLVVAAAAAVPVLRTFLRHATSGSPLTSDIDGSLSAKWASAAVLGVAIVSISRQVFAAAQATARFVDDPQSEAAKGSMQSVHDQLAGLIRQATRRRGSLLGKPSLPPSRLIIFVDDLERCRPPRAVDVCETANQLLSVANVVSVLIGDMQAVATAAALKYLPNGLSYDQADRSSSHIAMMSPFAYGRAYLEKIIQIQFSVPTAGGTAMRQLLASIGGRPSSGGPAADGPATQGTTADGTDAESASVLAAPSASRPPPQLGGAALRADEGRTDAGPAKAKPQDTGATGDLARVRQLKRWNDRMAAASGASLLIVWILLLLATSLPGWAAFLAGFGAAMVFAIPGVAAENRLEQLTGRKAAEVDSYIREVSGQANSVEELREAVQLSPAAQLSSPAFLDQRLQSFLIEDSSLRTRAEAAASRFVPALPRAAKRMINQLRLALAVAERRGMFDSISRYQPEHLGKWVVLVERWPELAIRLAARPTELARLESLRGADLGRAVAALAPDLDDYDELCELLECEPQLQLIFDHLVRFEPWALASASAARTSSGVEDIASAIPPPRANRQRASRPEQVIEAGEPGQGPPAG